MLAFIARVIAESLSGMLKYFKNRIADDVMPNYVTLRERLNANLIISIRVLGHNIMVSKIQ